MKLFEKSLSILDKDIFLRMDYIERFDEFLKSDNILVVQGQRRVGKSFAILGFLKNLKIDKYKIFYINKEQDERNEIKNSDNLSDLFDEYIKDFGQPEYIVIDEIQDIIEWERFIRARYSDKKYKIIISGSNSHLLSGELATYLTGRYLSLFIYPFDYKEFLDYNKTIDSNKNFNRYLLYGGLPEIVVLDNEDLKKNYLKTTLESIILKDIFRRYNIKDLDLLERILDFLASNVGSLVSIRKIYGYLVSIGYKDISLSTVSNYIKYLQNTFIINNVKRFMIKGKKILEQVDKYYFSDIGIRNISGIELAFDIGKLIENLVYLKLKKDLFEVWVGEIGDKEIDFVCKKGEITKYIQVSYLMIDENTKKREFGNFTSIKDNWEKIVISMDDIAVGSYEGVKWINLKEFLLS